MSVISFATRSASYRLSKDALTHAVRHLTRFGDTDVFPHLPELIFLRDCEADILKELEALDLDSYGPGSAVEALVARCDYINAHDNIIALGNSGTGKTHVALALGLDQMFA